MSSLDDHPTVRRLRAGGAQESTVEHNPPCKRPLLPFAS